MLAHGSAGHAFAQSPDPTRFEQDIAAFEAEDRAPPLPGAALFVGSSSIRYWDLARAFPGRRVIKREFGGSHVSDNVYFADRISFPYKPSLIVFYAGDADVAAHKTTDRIAADYAALIAAVHQGLPGTPMVIIGTKPSPAHWQHIDTIRRANALVEALAAVDPLVEFADVGNGLNLNERGYAAWTEAVRPAVELRWPLQPQ